MSINVNINPRFRFEREGNRGRLGGNTGGSSGSGGNTGGGNPNDDNTIVRTFGNQDIDGTKDFQKVVYGENFVFRGLTSLSTKLTKDLITGMCMLPSTGEHVYSSTPTTYTDLSNFSKVQNRNVEGTENTDFVIAVENLKRDVPATKWINFIVSWFGDDLRVGFCKTQPKVEHKEGATTPYDWKVGNYNRSNAKIPSFFDSSFYNGSYYSDSAVTVTPDYGEGVRGEMTGARVQHVSTGFNKFATNFTVTPDTDYIVKYRVKALNTDNQNVWARVEGGTGNVELDSQFYLARLDRWTEVEFKFNSGIHNNIDLQLSIGDSWFSGNIVSDIIIDIDSVYISIDNEEAFEGLAYGATPSDRSVVEGIQELKRQGYKVLFYPFLLMDIPEGNGKPDPSGLFEQPVHPWRGRITVMPNEDNTSFVRGEVEKFFGNCQPSDFVQDPTNLTVNYTGTPEDSFRKMILHYANLCVVAGGVDAFAVGTEMRGITWLRDSRTSFPAVEEFSQLISECKTILGSDCEVTYCADWTEVCPYQVQDGTGDVIHHLDELWMNPDCDFVGIDNYIPLSDWRDGSHLDEVWESVYNTDYLKYNIEGGELYDYFYASDSDRNNQIRTPITDWNYKVKDNKNWWLNEHFNRINGSWETTKTDWIPQSKRIVYTEFGCSAIDKGTNEPNKFLDPKSSESTAPRFSTGERDDLIQEKYYEAFCEYWLPINGNNPVSTLTGKRMVDNDMLFAWTWDGRPYPEFPNLQSVWSDGVNYPAGHWLMGREFITKTEE